MRFICYCKTLYFSCILIWRFFMVYFTTFQGIKFQLTLAMQHRIVHYCVTKLDLLYDSSRMVTVTLTTARTSIANTTLLCCWVTMKATKKCYCKSEFLWVFNFVIYATREICIIRLDACEKLVFYSISLAKTSVLKRT